MINERSLAYTETLTKSKTNRDPLDATLRLIIINLCNNMFEYEGMPKEIPTKLMEKILFDQGQAVFFQEAGQYFALGCANEKSLDVYNRMVAVKPIGLNGRNFPTKQVVETSDTAKNAVLIWNNLERISTWVAIAPIVNRLNYIWQSIGLVQALSRAKLMIKTSQNMKASVTKEMEKLFDGMSPVVAITDKYMEDNMETIETGVNANDVNPLWYDFDKTFALLLTCLGINSNMQADKKERMIVDEINSNNELIDLFKASMYEMRVEACNEINEVFGLNVSVKPYINEAKSHYQEPEKEVESKLD